MTRPAAHRPSRRDEIIDAAISVFAKQGFVDASISQVAEVAGVTVTAVYYHFSGKEDLYEAAMSKVFRTVDEVVATIRPDNAPARADTLNRVIDAVWDWIDEHPDAATLMHLHTPVATPRSADLRREFDEHHASRAFAYTAGTGNHHAAVANLAVRTLVDMLVTIHPMRLAGGPLSGHSSKQLRLAVKNVSARLVAAV